MASSASPGHKDASSDPQRLESEPTDPSSQPPKKVHETTSIAERLNNVPLRPHPPGMPVVITPVTPLPVMKGLKNSMHRLFKSVGNQLHIQNIRDQMHLPDSDWRGLLEDLSAMTPPRESWHTLILEAPTAAFDQKRLLESKDAGIRAIMERSGCAIATNTRLAEEGEIMTITVYGPYSRIQSAVDQILVTVGTAIAEILPLANAAPNSEQTPGSQATQTGEPRQAPLDVEAIISHYSQPGTRRVSLAHAHPVVEEIPRPDEWSVDSLDDYVALITSSRLERIARERRAREGHNMSHGEAVATIILDLFRDPEVIPFITITCFHRALHFLQRFSPALFRYEIELFRRASRNRRRLITAETFNIMLAASARLKDIGMFHRLVRIMRHFNCIPNFRTWSIALGIFDSVDVRRYILHILDRKGMLTSPVATRKIAVFMLPDDLQLALEKGMSLDQIMAHLDDLYGRREWWFTRKGGHSLINSLCRHARFDDAFSVACQMASPGRPLSALPNIVTLNTLLAHAATHRSTRFALAALEFHHVTCPHRKPDELTYKLLFDIFWRTRMPLSAAAVWHYAVLTGKAAKLVSRGPMGQALGRVKQFGAAPTPIDSSKLAQYEWGKYMRLHALISPLIASLRWHKKAPQSTSEQSTKACLVDQPTGVRNESQGAPTGDQDQSVSGEEVVQGTLCSVRSDDLLDPGFFDSHYAASIRESVAFLAAKFAGHMPSKPLHVLLESAFYMDTMCHTRISAALDETDQGREPQSNTAPTPESNKCSPRSTSGQGREEGALADKSTQIPDLPAGVFIINLSKTPDHVRDHDGSEPDQKAPIYHIKLVADYLTLYRGRQAIAAATPAKAQPGKF